MTKTKKTYAPDGVGGKGAIQVRLLPDERARFDAATATQQISASAMGRRLILRSLGINEK